MMMCPLWPLHIIFLYLLALCPMWYVACQVVNKAPGWLDVKFTPSKLEALMAETYKVNFDVANLSKEDIDYGVIKIQVDDVNIARDIKPSEYVLNTMGLNSTNWSSSFNITGNFLGKTSAKVELVNKKDAKQNKQSAETLPIVVTRKPTAMDRIFTGSVIALVSIIFINFGCALDIASLKQALVKPIGPIIGLLNHYCILPLVSYGLGLLLFPHSTAMRLGLFFTGVSPAGGASNIWTYSLGGNLNLSVTMTAVSTLASFAMIPLWTLTLGQVIFTGGKMGVPYSQIATSAVGLVIPLGIGYLIQIYCKRLSAIMVKILKPFSALLIIFIVVFATVTKLYLFKLFTWEIVVAGIALPWIGYLCGWTLSTVMRQKPEDRLAIAIETGVQNTGISIFMLRICLPQPEADLTTVIPVAVALMTPLPLLVFCLVKRFARSPPSKGSSSLPILEDGRPSLNADKF